MKDPFPMGSRWEDKRENFNQQPDEDEMQVPDIQRLRSHVETASMANIRERAHLADELWAIARKLYICLDKDLPDIESRLYAVMKQLVANSNDAAEIKKLEKGYA